MYQWGVDGGRPAKGKIGVAPEWFYKGTGAILRAHREPLEMPAFSDDGGEEAEVAGIYLVDNFGEPRRVGLALGNEFSDHILEKKNYLYLASSKLRNCAIGPELIINAKFHNARGKVQIERNKTIIWHQPFFTGEKNMCHTVANLEHHHFKYPAHCRPGDAHIHFFGADIFSFGDGIQLRDGDIVEIELAGFGRPLRNPIKINRSPQRQLKVKQL
ncbi:MAG: GguC protein, partial [Limisphaerales bacterium]